MRTHDPEAAPAPGRHRAVARRNTPEPQFLEAATTLRRDALDAASIVRLQRVTGNAVVAQLLGDGSESAVLDVVNRGGGEALEPGLRRDMEARLGSDFGDVRVHTDAQASASAAAINAQAYTVGSDIVFQAGSYEPETAAGQHVIAHELTHVAQQRAGPVAGTPAPGGIMISDPDDEFEQAAELSADRALTAAATSSPVVDAVTAQRQQDAAAEDWQEEGAAQALAVQREARVAGDLAVSGMPAYQRAEPTTTVPQTADTEVVAPSTPDIDALGLSATAATAARELRTKHPGVVFTSGWRSVHDQAEAMASNIVSSNNCNWIADTYVYSGKTQSWVDHHPNATSVEDLTAGLEETLNAMTDAQRAGVSKHMTGDAFDVQPVSDDADKIKADIQALPGLSKFLDQEAGLVRWHAQF